MSGLSVFAGVCIFFSSALVGLWVKKRLVSKAVFYEEYYKYLLFASEKISYERMPINEIKRSFPNEGKGDFYAFLMQENASPPLSEGEIGEVKKYLDEIGTTDAETQIASLNGKCAQMKRFSEEQCAKYRKDGTLYFKLSVLLGIVAFIIIV